LAPKATVTIKKPSIPNILLVQHDPKARNDLSSVLRRNSFLPVAVENCTHALYLLENETFSALLIVDQLVDLTPVELIMLSLQIAPELKVFYIDGGYNDEDRKIILGLGACDYLENSSNRNLIINALKKHL
jgi:DNA-binding response OmpR family regulator